MRILEINAVYGHASTGTIVKDLKLLCEKENIECFIASPDIKVRETSNGYVIGNIIDHKLHALLSRFNGKQGYFSLLSTKRLLKYIKTINPDIVHLHNLHSNYINLNCLLSFLAQEKIKTILTLHDCWFYTGGCFHYTAVNCFRWLNKCGNCPKKMQDIPAYFKDCSAQILNDRKTFFLKIPYLYVVGVSDWISNEAKRSFLGKTYVQTIHNGIDTDIFRPRKSNLRERIGLKNKYMLLGPASKWLLPENRYILDYFIEKMRDDEYLVLFGVSNVNVDIARNIKLLGFTNSREELAEIYSSADVFVNTTREDSLSLINVEAQACGTPVVTFDATGPKETVDGINSLHVPVGDAESLYKSVCQIRESWSENKAKECRNFILERFERSNNYKQYLDLYKKVYDTNF